MKKTQLLRQHARQIGKPILAFYRMIGIHKQFALLTIGKRVLGYALIRKRIIEIFDTQVAYIIYIHCIINFYILHGAQAFNCLCHTSLYHHTTKKALAVARAF